MNEITIVVLSCDKNIDIFDAFHHCMEKYWPNHPEVVYYTESVQNPYYRTIAVPHELSNWTTGFRAFLNQISTDKVLLMVDDVFIHSAVDEKRLFYCVENLKGNIAMFNLEKSWDRTDVDTDLIGFKKRQHGAEYEVSLLCGVWDKAKLIKVLERDCSPWTIELEQQPCGFDYYINSGDYIIDWGYETWKPIGLIKGKWSRNIVPFFEKENIHIDYSKRGFV